MNIFLCFVHKSSLSSVHNTKCGPVCCILSRTTFSHMISFTFHLYIFGSNQKQRSSADDIKYGKWNGNILSTVLSYWSRNFSFFHYILNFQIFKLIYREWKLFIENIQSICRARDKKGEYNPKWISITKSRTIRAVPSFLLLLFISFFPLQHFCINVYMKIEVRI